MSPEQKGKGPGIDKDLSDFYQPYEPPITYPSESEERFPGEIFPGPYEEVEASAVVERHGHRGIPGYSEGKRPLPRGNPVAVVQDPSDPDELEAVRLTPAAASWLGVPKVRPQEIREDPSSSRKVRNAARRRRGVGLW